MTSFWISGSLERKWLLTLDDSGVIVVYHDVDHERELWRALAERLDQAQHAEVMGQVGGVLWALFSSPPHAEALPDCWHLPEDKEQRNGKDFSSNPYK